MKKDLPGVVVRGSGRMKLDAGRRPSGPRRDPHRHPVSPSRARPNRAPPDTGSEGVANPRPRGARTLGNFSACSGPTGPRPGGADRSGRWCRPGTRRRRRFVPGWTPPTTRKCSTQRRISGVERPKYAFTGSIPVDASGRSPARADSTERGGPAHDGGQPFTSVRFRLAPLEDSRRPLRLGDLGRRR
jgi:hypothetical protein